MRRWRVESVIVLCWGTVTDDLLQMVILWRLWSLGVNAKVRIVEGRHGEDVRN
jgi:hypothetical protein